MKSTIVVGGGIAGILSANLLKRKCDKVYLIEKEDQIGGLLRSFRTAMGLEFDYGTHFLSDTGIPDLDQLLFGDANLKKWQVFDQMKVGNYFHSHLNTQSGFVDTRVLPEEIYQKGMIELLSSTEEKRDCANLEELLNSTLGETYTREICAPIVKKLLGKEAHELVADVVALINFPSRLIGLTPAASRELKKLELYDKKLAFHSYKEVPSAIRHYYPRSGGIGQWVKEQDDRLTQAGVEILRSTTVEKIHHKDGRVHSITMNDGSSLECDQVIWTIPTYQCISLSGLNQKRMDPPFRLGTSLHHFVYDKPFSTDVYYLMCFEPNMLTFRVTLYPNVQIASTSEEQYHLTVEVLSPEELDLDETARTVHKELQEMGIVSTDANILFQHSESLQNTFPVSTHQFVQDSKAQLEFAREQLKNVLFLGKNVGNTWFMHEVLTETYNAIMEL